MIYYLKLNGYRFKHFWCLGDKGAELSLLM